MQNRCILINDTDTEGIPYQEDNSLLILGKPRSYGLLLKATPYAIYKRGGFGDWSQWVELFGMPQRVGKYNAYDPESRKLLEQAMEQAGSAPYLIIPKEAEVETKSSSNTNGTSYNEFRQACNEEMLITVLGQTLTTVQGEYGARSLGEVHKQVEEGKNRSDMRFVQRVLNHSVLPMLQARGYPVAGGKFIFPKSAEQLSVADIVQLSDILPIPQSYLHEKYSIPVPQQGEEIARRQAIASEQTNIDAPKVKKEKETTKKEHTHQEETEGKEEDKENEEKEEQKLSDISILKRMWDFFALAPIIPKMGASKFKIPTSFNDTTLDARLIKGVAKEEITYFDAELFQYISKDLLNAIHTAFKRSIKHADYTYSDLDPAFITALEQNVFHFSAAKTLAEIQKLNQTLKKARSFADFQKRAASICRTYNKVWQKTEYDTALLTAEAAANYQRLIKKNDRFPYWQYVTAGDNKVREEHRNLNGVTLFWDDPRWDKIFPPNGWKCRCRVKPLLRHEANEQIVEASRKQADAYMRTAEWAKVKATHFDYNPGKREHIFNANQMYVRKFPQKAAKLMGYITPDDWGLKHSYKQLIRDAKAKIKPYEGTAQQWWEEHKTTIEGVDQLIVKDYNNRAWCMNKKEFDIHTTDTKKKRAFRTKYLDMIQQVINDPDEVWLGQDPDMEQTEDNYLNQWLYIKYYEGVAIVCVCKIQNQQMNFKTWYELHDNKVRKGMLVFRK